MKVISLIVGLILIASTVFAAPRFVWDDPNSGGAVEGYRIYLQHPDGVIKRELPSGVNQVYISELDLPPGTHFTCWITAFNVNGESIPSNKIEYYSSVPNAPVLRLIITVNSVGVTISGE